MKRKIALALVVASLLVLALAVTVMAQGAGPGPGNGIQAADGTCLSGDFVDADGDGVCDNVGTGVGLQSGRSNGWNGDGTANANGPQQGMMNARRAMGGMRGMNGAQAGMGQGFADADSDGVCDNFTDADGDGTCDSCLNGAGNGAGTQQGMSRQGMQGRGRWSHGQ